MRRVRSVISRLWASYRLVRLVGWLMGVGSTISMFMGGVWVLWSNRMRTELRTDAPEYVENTTTPPDGTPVSDQPFAWNMSWVGSLVPWLVGVLLLLLVLRVIVRWPMRRPHNGGRDERRLFTDADKDWSRFVSGNQCEYRSLFGLYRCRRRVEEFDHWYPWARGGATERGNMVAMCQHHNRVKSDHVPSIWQTRSLAYARLHYYPVEARGYAYPDPTRHRSQGRIQENDG